MMNFFIVAILFAFARPSVTAKTTDCVRIHYKGFQKEILLNDIESPYQLAIDHDTNTLFFSYTARTDEMFKSAYFSLKTGRYGIVRGIRGGFANAVSSTVVYMGGEDGIYTYDYSTKTANNLYVQEKANIWQMFYKDGLYFTTYPEEEAFFYKENKVVEVPALQGTRVTLLAVTAEKDLLYFNSTGAYLYSRADEKYSFLSDVVANGVAADLNGKLYVSSPTGIYYYNDDLKEMEHLTVINNVYGIAIESDGNIIYASENSIIRLNPMKGACFEEKVHTGKNIVEIDIEPTPSNKKPNKTKYKSRPSKQRKSRRQRRGVGRCVAEACVPLSAVDLLVTRKNLQLLLASEICLSWPL
ncbi:hypothetical protein PYW08_001689 [Mythimna loreyi]|uniref:Uncharacterized protein n=1 Tax=Mythimna loreyi TaxID=667449 RepID=A0ACC2RA20_9NEOP|nr:hypothetical protein PYW08_001689 [Mythimna loreyi]